MVPGLVSGRGEDWDVDEDRELPFAARVAMLAVLGLILGLFIIVGVGLAFGGGAGVSPG